VEEDRSGMGFVDEILGAQMLYKLLENSGE
jgi:hypothetical protein